MRTIYNYNNEFDKAEVIKKMNDLGERAQEEREKKPNEYDRKRELELVYAQFLQGLRLSIR